MVECVSREIHACVVGRGALWHIQWSTGLSIERFLVRFILLIRTLGKCILYAALQFNESFFSSSVHNIKCTLCNLP